MGLLGPGKQIKGEKKMTAQRASWKSSPEPTQPPVFSPMQFFFILTKKERKVDCCF
jgi:hypothetical protein